MKLSRNIMMSLFACGTVAAVVIACGSDDESKFKDPNANNGVFGDGGFGEGGDNGPDLYANDPPPPWCGPDSGAPPPPIQGTLECPEDKNKPGCGCEKPGDTAPCWTGLRKNRNLGVCKDGVATCKFKNENLNVWGPCEGQVLPVPDGKGGERCSCFSVGTWAIANTSPCIWSPDGDSYYAYSTVLGPAPDFAAVNCTQASHLENDVMPSSVWSSDTLTVDCAGDYNLVFRIHAGDAKNKHAEDCTLGEVSIQTGFVEARKSVNDPEVVNTLPDLPAWVGKDDACAKKWEHDTPEDVSPGYGDMIVKGKSVQCDEIDDGHGNEFVFHTVTFCPRICRPGWPTYDATKMTPSGQTQKELCDACQLSGKGEFKAQ
jgi:hypothetical protein